MERKIVEYCLVIGDADDVETGVCELIDDGFQPYLSPLCTGQALHDNPIFCQALVKYQDQSNAN